jgi:valyl-tRNA synthetase
VWEWKEKSGNTITTPDAPHGRQRGLEREYFTMDDKLSKVGHRDLRALYEQGLIYRGKRLVNWDPVLQPPCPTWKWSEEEEDGFMWHIRYPLADGSGSLVVATTRPETMLGDVAVMVHPEDERYPPDRQDGEAAAVRPPNPGHRRRLRRPRIRHRRGQGHAGARLQRLRRRPAPQLPMIIFTLDAKINDNAPRRLPRPGPLRRRKAVVADLEAARPAGRRPKKHKLMVPRCDRTGQVIEPMLTDQWFVAMSKVATRTPRQVIAQRPSTRGRAR